MSESERRHGYRYNRVLIETARILSTTFPDAAIHVTGAQLELLRNLMEYLNRQETFVTTYNDGYYLSPTVGEWDSLLAIIADLEEVLMGNENVLWGYNDTYRQQKDDDGNGGTLTQTFESVPDDEVWVVTGFIATPSEVDHPNPVSMSVYDGSNLIRLRTIVSLAVNTMLQVENEIVMNGDDYVQVVWHSSLPNVNYRSVAFGYKMKIPG